MPCRSSPIRDVFSPLFVDLFTIRRQIAGTSLVGGGVHQLDMPPEAKITYLTRPFTTRLQHRHEFIGAEAKEEEDTLLMGM
jgi:hypothetical protein